MKSSLFATSLIATSMPFSPAIAQQMDHSGHTMPGSGQTGSSSKTSSADCSAEAAGHRAMGHSSGGQDCPPTSSPSSPANGETSSTQNRAQDPAAMDHGQMNHAQAGHDRTMQPSMPEAAMEHMGHAGMEHPAATDQTIPMLPPPREAGSGPARAAIRFWGEDSMKAARKDLIHDTDGGMRFWFQADRAELRLRKGKNGFLWDIQGYYGGDIDKFWYRSEGEGITGGGVERAEVQGLWSHAIAPFFDFQAGVRQDLTGPSRTYAVAGIQGLAPYRFEVIGAAFLSNKGELTARMEAELDQRITQRLILQPRAEINLSAQDVPELGIGAGLDKAEVGLRLRYEFAREFAPYIGIEQEWKAGKSADFARAAGEDPSVTNYLVGVRFWF